MFALFLACTSTPSSPSGTPEGVDSAAPTDTGATETPVVDPLPYSGGTCPTLTDGVNRDFVSGDLVREFRVVLPAEPAGAGVVFAWHWLGGSARQILDYMQLETWAEDHGLIIIAPEASGEEDYEWAFLDGPRGNPDALFFDDMLACADATWGVDRDAVHATGMSAGGVWTTWLTLYRSDVLATTAPISGGTSVYTSPDEPIPVLVTWGGPTDTYQGYSFDDASRIFVDGLRADGHFVVTCVHDGGHTIPAEATDYVGRFFADHRRGLATEPYADGLPDPFPTWCALD